MYNCGMSDPESTTVQRGIHDILGDLVFSAHRLTRLAAHATQNQESPAVWRTLGTLAHSGPMRVGELARHGRVSQPTMSKIITRLDSEEWIRRIADSGDARAQLLDLTPAGLAALENWRQQLLDQLLPRFSDLDPADLDALDRAAAVLTDRVGPGRGDLA